MTDSLAAVQARIAEIQQRFAPAPVTRSGGSAGAFRSALAEATGATAAAGSTAGSPDGSGSGRTSSALTGEQVVSAARRYLGVPYRWGGTNPAVGLDCSGFVQRVYGDLGIDLPRVSRDQARAGTPIASLADARPGDLVAFGTPVDHIGIYVGDGKMIVAPRTGDVVKIAPVYRTPTAIRRILPDAAPAGPAATTPVPVPATVAGRAGTAAGPGPYAAQFAAAGARHGVSPALLQAVARAESGFDPTAVSRAGARGLIQLMPATARSLGVDPFDPAQAIDGAARLLARHLRDFGSVPLALAAYNAGPGAVRRFDGIPPYAETQAYVRRVQSYLSREAA